MASSYDRKFVFLSPEDKGYELGPGKNPRGHIDIEKRNNKLNMKIFLENLKDMNYHIQLFTPEGNYVTLEEILIGKDGKADKKISTSSDNLMGSGIDWENFAGIVIKPADIKSTFKIALSAWIKGKKDTLPFPVLDKAKNTEPERKIEEVKEEPKIHEPIEEQLDTIKEIEEMEELEIIEQLGEMDEVEDIQEEVQKVDYVKDIQEVEKLEKIEVIEEVQEIQEEGIQEIEELEELDWLEEIEEVERIEEIEEVEEKQTEELVQELQEELDQVDNIILDEEDNKDVYWVDFDQTYKKEIDFKDHEQESHHEPLESPYYYINENLNQIEKNILSCTPFHPPLKNHKWLTITGKEKDLEKFYLFFNGSFVHLTYPYMEYRNIGPIYREKYKDMIFGMVYDEKEGKKNLKYYVYGIPGRFCLQEQPYQGRTGFLYWQPVDYKNRGRGDIGYWLLYVDAQSGSIAIPKRPTIPPVCKDLNNKY